MWNIILVYSLGDRLTESLKVIYNSIDIDS